MIPGSTWPRLAGGEKNADDLDDAFDGVFLLVLCAPFPSGAVDSAVVGVEIRPGLVRVSTEVVLSEVTDVQVLSDGARLTVEMTEGLDAFVTLRFLTTRTLEVEFEAAQPQTLEAAGERLRSPRRERIYGLTERLRDSSPLLPGVIDIPADDIRPPETGSLNRRGETVEMRVLPTFSLYASFFHGSRGFGLSVAGATFGRFDLGAASARTLSFRFEMGTTPESRRLRFHVFVAAEYITILDEYTALVGRPFVPPDWAFKNWRSRSAIWHRSHLRTGLVCTIAVRPVASSFST